MKQIILISISFIIFLCILSGTQSCNVVNKLSVQHTILPIFEPQQILIKKSIYNGTTINNLYPSPTATEYEPNPLFIEYSTINLSFIAASPKRPNQRTFYGSVNSKGAAKSVPRIAGSSFCIFTVLCLIKNSKISFIVIMVSIINISYGANIYSPWTTFEYPDPVLPRNSDGMAIGYDHINNRVWLLGGWPYSNKNQLVSFSTKDGNFTFTDHGEYNLSQGINAVGQSYSQLEDALFMIDPNGNNLFKFNFTTTYFQNYKSIPPGPNSRSCLASLGDNYLIIGMYTSIFILNITSNEWIFTTPDMKHGRHSHACIVHKQQFYAIAGVYEKDSIEVLYVGDLNTIQNEEFTFIQSLPQILKEHRAINYEDDILVLGGYVFRGINWGNIYVINTLTNNVTTAGALNYPVSSMAPIIIYPYIYIFGGWTWNGEEYTATTVNKWQYHIPPTLAPTSSPSTAPTGSPSSEPSFSPSTAPIFPTIPPTLFPTISPTKEPTLTNKYLFIRSTGCDYGYCTSSTSNYNDDICINKLNDIAHAKQYCCGHTKDPTIEPTVNPTNTPTVSTLEPTYNPTYYPTKQQTSYPTIKPTT
eukprot:153531_1